MRGKMKRFIITLLCLTLGVTLCAIKPTKEKTMKILVLYSSQTGTTQEIAKFMAQELVKAGHQADLMQVDKAKNLNAYDAMIIGAPVYIGKWKADAQTFVKDHANILKEIPHAYFMVGTSFNGKASPAEMRAILAKVREISPPVSEGKFMGRLDYSRLNFFQRTISRLVKAPEGDFRDWDAIRKWTLDTLGLFQRS